MHPAIRVEDLSKCYRITSGRELRGYHTLRDSLTSSIAALWSGRKAPGGDGATEPFWALKDVGFDVQPGEVAGVIGRNGAGKSTLLKVLSRITRPTTGAVTLRGRVGSLLEVGTGFHQELSGRENIFLNGALLGLSRAEIRSHFDEIVEFAEVGKFLDTPVKRYSSGMYVRLAFAVAAQLRSDILLVDEVLAVGDANFQKKCLARMGEVGREGRTVLFVSHNMHSVALLCRRALLLEEGRVTDYGPTADVIGRYLGSRSGEGGEVTWPVTDAPSTALVKLAAVRVRGNDGRPCSQFATDSPVTLETEFCILRRTRMTPSFHVYNQHGLLLFASANLHDPQWGAREYEPGRYTTACTVPANFFNDGPYYVTLYLTRDNNAKLIDVIQHEAISFRVSDAGAARGDFAGEWIGLVRPLLPWTGARVGDLS